MFSNRALAELAGRHGLTLDAASISTTSSGLDFLVAFATDIGGVKWVLRVPRRPDALDRARKERRILELIAGRLPVQTPRWEVFSDEIIAYRQLDGLPAGVVDMETKAYVWRIDEKNVPASLERSLARALAALHAIDPAEAGAAGVKVLTPAQLRRDMHDRMLRARAEFGVSRELWERWQRWLANDALWPGHTALVHGDLHAGHILIDDAAGVTGIIDWTEGIVGDPALDFAPHRTVFGEGSLQRLVAAYQEAGGCVWPGIFEHLAEMEAAYGVSIAEFAMSSGLEEYRRMARECLGVAV